MRRLVIPVVVAMGVVASATCLAQFGSNGMGGGLGGMGGMMVAPGRVTLLTEGGNQITGMLPDRPWKIKTDELGTLEIPTKSIASVEFGTDKGDRVTTWQNSILLGRIELDAVELDSEFGPISIDRSKVKSILGASGMVMMGGMSEFAEPVTEPKKEN